MERLNYEPVVSEEHASGMAKKRLGDILYERREIACLGDIDAGMVNSIIMQLRYLELTDPGKEITIIINSPGGSVDSGLALYDVMKGISSPIRTVCVGIAASMGAMLFASGDRRQILPHGRVMIHDPLITQTGGNALALKTISDSLMETRRITAEILAEDTGKTIDEILEKTRSDCWFYAKEAVDFNLADEIITTI